jgi:putative membrane-bound dehydrogenase-like protein
MLHRIVPREGNVPSMRLAVCALGFAAIVLAGSSTARAQISPEESAKKLKPAEGMEATLWASEPMVINPTNMDIDSRGRVWITEGLNYRLTHGKPFKRVANADAIKILEDTDHDGKADKVTIFADNIFPIPMGLAVEENYGPDGKYKGCKVYIGNSPDLLVLEDTDGDDKADKRSALLTGFGGIDSDHGVHGMVLGLDGLLYFTHGDGCCSYEQSDGSHNAKNFDVIDKSGRHVSSDQLANTLRVRRDGTQFEIIADRQRNNYETSLNSFGNIFTSDNDDDGNHGSRVIWVMDGGKYGYRTPGSPRHWGEEVPGNVPKLVGTGNGSPCGIMVYEGNLLGKDYFGAVFEADAGTRQINFMPITRKGAAFRSDYKVLLGSDDPWFRPVDMTAAPDGSVFVADWYDGGVGGHAFRDQTTGRIYRVAPKGDKSKAIKYDFATDDGLIAALKSPTIAAQDAARRTLIESGRGSVWNALEALFASGEPVERSRALWVASQSKDARGPLTPRALTDADPRIREQAVRMLGRDNRENGKVEYQQPDREPLPSAVHNLTRLLPLAADPDAGVRRELILALRNVPTEQVSDALKTLTKLWDGQDRWYLEALGLALEKREPAFISSLFDGTLYGDLDLDEAGQASDVALPPYFPVDRNEAYIPAGTIDAPANALSKTIGLAWRLHRPEILPLLSRVLPELKSPEMQQAADDVFAQMRDPETAVVLADLAMKTDDPTRKRQLLGTIARKLDTTWKPAQHRPEVLALVEAALKDPGLRLEGTAVAASTGDNRFVPTLIALVGEKSASDELKSSAVESLARLNDSKIKPFLLSLIEATKGQKVGTASAEAALRSLAKTESYRPKLLEVMSGSYPVGLRREALRGFARLNDGGDRLLALAKEGKIPDDLKIEATTALAMHPDRRVRMEAGGVLPLPNSRGGKPLPSFFELVRREGKADRGRDVFFRAGTNACAGCHRVQGRGQWIGPDLSTIGTKYGRDELVRSILNPSAAIGYNFRSLIVALDDGRVLTGLPIEDTPDRLVLKTADGQRIAIRPAQIEDRKSSDVSLMPEGLAETMTDQEIVDLLTFLATLKQPVSIVGQYQAVGPLADKPGAPAVDPSAKLDHAERVAAADGKPLAWRRLDANAESLADLSILAGDDPAKAAYVHVPVSAPASLSARLVIDTRAEITAWLDGKAVELARGDETTRTATVSLPKGQSNLLIRVPGGAAVSLVTTFVADKPLSFQAIETKVSAR